MKKKLYRSATSRMLGGVCGGIADYLDVDPTVVRLVWIILSLSGGSGLLAYALACLLIPYED